MIEIENTILSRDLIEKKFVCDIEKCKGLCCVEGDSGAPLEKKEIKLLEKNLYKILPYLRGEGRQVIEENGVYVIDWDSDFVTPLVNERECAYAIFDEGIAKCGIEKAYLDKITSFRKPISCFLYPVRVQKLKQFDAVNYDKWNICKSAIALGNELKTPIYKFLKEPLSQKYGEEWYNQLKLVATELAKS